MPPKSDRSPQRVAAEGRDVALNPLERSKLVHVAVVADRVVWRLLSAPDGQSQAGQRTQRRQERPIMKEPPLADCVDLHISRRKTSGRTPRRGGENDPLKPKGRSARPLYSCCHARHLFTAKISETRRSVAGTRRVRGRPRSNDHFQPFRALAWEVANEAARQLGWIRS